MSGADDLVDHLFRAKAGQMVATLTRIFGAEHLSLAEDVVQEALVAALSHWRLGEIPDDPAAWIFRVARNRALDTVRRKTNLEGKSDAIRASFEELTQPHAARFGHEVDDDPLRMILLCGHPEIPADSAIALTLKTVGGFSAGEIARAFLSTPETISQRIVRAKRTIRERQLVIEFPSRDELPRRRDMLLRVLYLMFNEGYSAQSGEDVVRTDVAFEAIRLSALVAAHPFVTSPAAHALCALMLLHASRFPARATGEALHLLGDQDRALWDRGLIARGMQHLDASIGGEEISRYHVEAAIAAEHARAEDLESTEWERVVELYDQLLLIEPSPVVMLNRAIARAMITGPQAGIDEVRALETLPSMRGYPYVSSTLGELWLRSGDPDRAMECFSRALDAPISMPEKRYILQKIEQCRAARPARL